MEKRDKACGQQVEDVASDGRVKGYCAIAKQYVNFPIDNTGAWILRPRE